MIKKNASKGEDNMKKSAISEILINHQIWLSSDGYDGKRADFSHEDLHGTDFSGLDLSNADFTEANLSGAEFIGTTLNIANFNKADLSGADLTHAVLNEADLQHSKLHGADLFCTEIIDTDLTHADLSDANLRGTDFGGSDLRLAKLCGAKISNVNLRGAFLPDGIYMVAGLGSKDGGYIYYDSNNDFVKCGYWDDGNGNRLDSFKKRVEEVYGPNGEKPNSMSYKAYQSAINYFEVCRDEHIDHMMDSLS